jgi:multidrug efflux pump subunit AcrA (membrane-fusion protein)
MSEFNYWSRFKKAIQTRGKLRRLVLNTSILSGFLLVSFMLIVTTEARQPTPRLEKSWPVSVVDIQPTSKSPTLILYGKVESNQVANLKTSVSAIVSNVLAPEGQWVNRGQILVQLQEDELVLAVAMAQAEHQRQLAKLKSVQTDYDLAHSLTPHHKELHEISQAKLKRHQDLARTGMVADSVLDAVRTQASERAITLQRHMAGVADFPNVIAQQQAMVSEAEARLGKARMDLAQSRITAPFSGRVIKTLVAPGDRTLPGSSIIQVANHEGLEVRTSVPGRVGRTLREQLNDGIAVVATGRLDDHTITFYLDRLSGEIKQGQTGLDAFFRSESRDVLDIGRVVNLHVSLPPVPDTVALPIQSLYENNKIYRVEENRLVGIDVEEVGDYIDADNRFRVLIRSKALQPGDRIITTQLPRAITGLLVEPLNSSELETADL